MALVTGVRLNNYMNEPSWSEDQYAEADRICEQVEARLSARLNTPLSPTPWAETVAVLRTGLVATTYPVLTVTRLNDVAIPEGDPLPDGWVIQNNRLRVIDPAATPTALTVSSLTPSIGMSLRVDGIGSASVEYQAGWGPVTALVDGILEKAKAIMTNRHDDTIVIRDLDAQAPPPEEEDWTETEINQDFGIYRNLVIFR